MQPEPHSRQPSSASAAPPPARLVIGASGAVGRALLEYLAGSHAPTLALSRATPPPWADAMPAVAWQRASLEQLDAAGFAGSGVVFSAGPLDGLAAWLERAQPRPARIVALSSTSRHVKTASPDPVERALAQRLGDAEARCARYAEGAGIALSVLRPTLIVSARDGDALDAIAAVARRLGFALLPGGACGLRQPVHATAVAQAMWACAAAPISIGRSYDLPGGETLSYLDLVRRLLAARAPSARILRLPTGLYRLLAATARRHRALAGLSDAVIARMAEDLVFDAQPAIRDFAYAPGALVLDR